MVNYVTAAGVQQFSITIAVSSTTGTLTLATAVGTGAFITYGGSNPVTGANFAEAGAYLSWSTTGGVTTITATRNTGTAGTVVVTGSITDGDTTNLIASVQQGTVTIAIGNTSGTAPVTGPSSDSNAAIHYMGQTAALSSLTADEEYAYLTQSSTTVTANVPLAGGTPVIGFCLIEFRSACLTTNAVQRISATSSSNVTSFKASLGANVVLNNAISFWGGKAIATVTTNDVQALMYGALTGVGTFNVTVNTGTANAKTYNASIAEFNSGVLNSAVQRGTTTLTGVTSNSSTITAVNESYAGVSWLGNSTTAGPNLLSESTGAVALGYIGAMFVKSTALGGFSSGSAQSVTSTNGNFLIIAIDAPGTSSVPAVTGITDSSSQTWIQVPSAASQNTTSGHSMADIWYFPNSAALTTITPTLTNSSSSSVFMTVYEFSGMASSNYVDVVGTPLNSQAASTSWESPAITTTKAVDVIITSMTPAPSAGNTVAAPYTFTGTPSAEGMTAYYIPQGEVTNSQATFTVGSSKAYGASAAAFFSTLIEAVIVTQNNATANITGSWETFEFPAYSAPASGLLWLPVYDADLVIDLLPLAYDNIASPGWLLNLPMPWLPADVAPAPPIIPPDKPTFFGFPLPLNLKIPFLPRLNDVPPPVPPPGYSAIAMNVQPIVTGAPIPFLPKISDAPPIIPVDKPNFFGFPLPLKLPIPWLSKTFDAPPVIQPDKPNFFSNVFSIFQPQTWFPRQSDAPPIIPPDKPTFFGFPITVNFSFPWFPKITTDAPPLTPAYRESAFNVVPTYGPNCGTWDTITSQYQTMVTPWNLIGMCTAEWLPSVIHAIPNALASVPSFFSNIFPIAQLQSWFPTVANAAPVTQPEKPTFFGFPLPVNFSLSWLPTRVADAPPITPVDKTTIFGFPLSLSFSTKWLSTRVYDAAPLMPADKPTTFMPRWLLNLPIPWLSRVIDAPPITPSDKPSFFSNVFPIGALLTWLPRIADAPPLTPADKPTVFSPRWLLNLPMPWLSKTIDAPPLTPADKPNYFAPGWLLNFTLSWLPKTSTDAPPVTSADRPTFFGFPLPESFTLSWLPRINDPVPHTPEDKPNYFAPRWLLNIRLPWLPKISTDAPPITPAAKETVFMPPWLLNFKLPWLPTRVVDAPPITPPDKPTTFMPPWKPPAFIAFWFPSITHAEPPSKLPPEAIVVVPGTLLSTITGALLYPVRRTTTLYPKVKNVILSPYRGLRRRKYDE